jgi:acetyl-CoA C-acetyltransferase
MTRVPMFSDCSGEPSPALQKQHPDLVQQGVAAEIMAEMFKISRAELDKFAVRSQELAAKAQDAGNFKKSVIAVPYKDDTGAGELAVDDNIRRGTTMEALAGLKTVFKEVGGVITAGNASAIVDGAAAVLLASEKGIKAQNLKPRARIVSHFSVGSPPRVMLTGPVAASQGALQMAKLSVKDIDIWEINEAFAPVPLYTMRELKIDESRINVNGGGISLGHPLGATGAMLIGMAIDELERANKRYACVTMCIGLGMGIATIIEKV